ncbi:MAG: histidine phosphatase family protein [Chloroflexi bacterium]|nr:histidine phosphatase family protein [Chloroflexota bacterium]
MRLYLVRHGETQRNRDRLVQGGSNSDGLTELGMLQAAAAARALAGLGITALFTSTVPRAVETCRLVGEALGIPPELAPGLEELDTGVLDGLTSQEMRTQYPDFMAQWDRDAGAARLPGGETMLEVQARAWSAIEDIVRRHPEGTAAVVSHNFTICTLVCKALDLPIAGFRRFRVDLGSISALELAPQRPRLLLLNSTFHLASLESGAPHQPGARGEGQG